MTITELIEELNDALEMGLSGDADVVLVSPKGGFTKPYDIDRTLKAEAGSLYLAITRTKD